MGSLLLPGMRAAALLLALAAAACAPLQREVAPPQQPAGCRVTLAADLPATIAQNTLVIEATADAHPLRLLVDTGASGGGALSDQAVRRLGLAPEPGMRAVTTIAGLMAQSQRVRVAQLRVGELPPVEAVMAVMPGEAAGILSARADGLLGAAILSRYDVEIDPEARRMRFHAVEGCAGGLVPFAEPHQTLPIRLGPFEQIYVLMRIDGAELLALVDTGYNGEVLILTPGAERLGIGGDEAADLARGVGRDFTGRAVPVRVRRVGSITLGMFTARNAPVTVLVPQAGGAPAFVQADALLGGGFLLRRRVWISYATGRLHVADRIAAPR